MNLGLFMTNSLTFLYDLITGLPAGLSRTSNYVSALLITAICPSIHSSVTLVIHAQIVQHIEMPFARSDRAMLDARFLSGS